jgi:hypothetical protein
MNVLIAKNGERPILVQKNNSMFRYLKSIRSFATTTTTTSAIKKKYDVIVVGAG